jgi:hypothetical protein
MNKYVTLDLKDYTYDWTFKNIFQSNHPELIQKVSDLLDRDPDIYQVNRFLIKFVQKVSDLLDRDPDEIEIEDMTFFYIFEKKQTFYQVGHDNNKDTFYFDSLEPGKYNSFYWCDIDYKIYDMKDYLKERYHQAMYSLAKYDMKKDFQQFFLGGEKIKKK